MGIGQNSSQAASFKGKESNHARIGISGFVVGSFTKRIFVSLLLLSAGTMEHCCNQIKLFGLFYTQLMQQR